MSPAALGDADASELGDDVDRASALTAVADDDLDAAGEADIAATVADDEEDDLDLAGEADIAATVDADPADPSRRKSPVRRNVA